MTLNPEWLAMTASRSDTSKKPITTKNTTMTKLTTILLVAIISVTCALLMEHWQKKQQRKHWQRYVDTQAERREKEGEL